MQKSTKSNLTKHQAVRYLPKNSTECKQKQIRLLEYSKKENNPIKCIYFERSILEFKVVDEQNLETVMDNLLNSMQVLEINVSEVLCNSTKTERKRYKRI